MSDTIDLKFDDKDVWVAVATNPIGLRIKSNGRGRWHFAAIAGIEAPDDDDLQGEVYEGISDRYVESFIGIIYVKVDTEEHLFSVTSDIGATHTVQSNGVPASFTKITSNSSTVSIVKGGPNKIAFVPRIINEHVENADEIQAVVSAGNIVNQIFRMSTDNISAWMMTIGSAAGILLDDFEGYADSTALQVKWVESNIAEPATLETGITFGGDQAMRLPCQVLDDEWMYTIGATDYEGFTGIFDAYTDKEYNKCKISVFIGDGTNTKSQQIVQAAKEIWQKYEIAEAGMVEDILGNVTNVNAITQVGFRVDDAENNRFFIIDNLVATPPGGELEMTLHDMGKDLPVSGETSIDDGEQYDQIGPAKANSFTLFLKGGKRLYHVHQFFCGVYGSNPDNKPLIEGNYYLMSLKYVDTMVNIYGPPVGDEIQYYYSGFACTAPDTATPITKIDEYSNIMFGVFSAYEVYFTDINWRFDADPDTGSDIHVFIEDVNKVITDTIIDHEPTPEREFSRDVSVRPMRMVKGGELQFYYNDEVTDLVRNLTGEGGFLYEPPFTHG